ncbi:MAG: cytochrome P450 [Sulfobacillus sp.]|nr:cytochrome P450 [Sulfobacillus sp.]
MDVKDDEPQTVPGPIAGGWRHLMWFHRQPLEWLKSLADRYGPLTAFRLGPWPFWLASGPQTVGAILRRHGKEFIKGPGLQTDNPLIGAGLLTTEGSFWAEERRREAPLFTSTNVKRLLAADMMPWSEKWADALPTDRPVELHSLFLRGTLDVVIRTLFADSGPKPLATYQEDLAWIMHHFYHRLRSPFRPPYHWPWPFNRLYHRHARRLETFFDQWHPEPKPYETLGSRLNPHDPDDRAKAVTLLMAGQETTANALTWTIRLLATHPDWQQRLWEQPEVVDWVIQESLRLYPPVWLISRETTRSVALEKYELPPHAKILISPWVSHRNPDVFVDPAAFHPQRWQSAAPRLDGYFPFGGGPRRCIGQAFALGEMRTVIEAIVARYRIEPVGPDPTVFPAMTLEPGTPVYVQFQNR